MSGKKKFIEEVATELLDQYGRPIKKSEIMRKQTGGALVPAGKPVDRTAPLPEQVGEYKLIKNKDGTSSYVRKATSKDDVLDVTPVKSGTPINPSTELVPVGKAVDRTELPEQVGEYTLSRGKDGKPYYIKKRTPSKALVPVGKPVTHDPNLPSEFDDYILKRKSDGTPYYEKKGTPPTEKGGALVPVGKAVDRTELPEQVGEYRLLKKKDGTLTYVREATAKDDVVDKTPIKRGDKLVPYRTETISQQMKRVLPAAGAVGAVGATAGGDRRNPATVGTEDGTKGEDFFDKGEDDSAFIEPSVDKVQPPKVEEEPAAVAGVVPATGEGEEGGGEPTAATDTDISPPVLQELPKVKDPVGEADQYELVDSEYKQALADAMSAYKATKDQQDSARLWEAIIHGIGHLAAGVIGMKEGLDLSGLKFSKTDWDAEYKRSRKDLKQVVDNLKNQRVIAQVKLNRGEKRERQIIDDIKYNNSLKQQAYQNAVATQRAKRQEAFEREQFEWRKKREGLETVARTAMASEDPTVKQRAKEYIKSSDDLDSLREKIATAKTRKVREELLDTFRSRVQQHEQLAGSLGVTPSYSMQDIVADPGWISTDYEISEEQRRARLATPVSPEPPKKPAAEPEYDPVEAYNTAIARLKKDPNNQGAKSAKLFIEKNYPHLFTKEK